MAFVRVTNEKLKSYGSYGILYDTYEHTIKIKLIASGKIIQIRKDAIEHCGPIELFKQNNVLGTIRDSCFYYNISGLSMSSDSWTKLRVRHWLYVNDEVSFQFKDKKIYLGKIVDIQAKECKITVGFYSKTGYEIVSLGYRDIRLPSELKPGIETLKYRPKAKNEMNTSKLNTVVPLSRIIYELSWVLDSTSQKKIFDSFDAMKSFVNELDPKVITNVQYVRFIETETTQVKPVQMFDI